MYDALTSKRAYKNAFAHSVARSIILEGSGTHFDPDIVDAFLQVESEFVAVREHFATLNIAITCRGDGVETIDIRNTGHTGHTGQP